MKKTKFTFATGLIILSIISVLSYNAIFNKTESEAEIKNDNVAYSDIETISSEELKNIGKDFSGEIEADYQDYSDSLEDMKDIAVLIVRATVTEQIQYSDMSVQSRVEVSKTLKGDSFDQIRIYQLGTIGEDNVLSPDKEYLLFLGKQTDGEKDTFFINGGEQGIIAIDNNKIDPVDPVIKKDLEEVKKEMGDSFSLESLEENMIE